MRLLIVEDEVRLASTLADLLHRQGYTADICHDGLTGLDNARSGSENRTDDAILCGDLRLEQGSFLLSCGQRSVRLSRREYDLMELLMRNSKIILTKEQILLKVWGYDSEAEDNNAEVYISFLRRKLTHLHSTVKIKTIRLVGYCLEVEE